MDRIYYIVEMKIGSGLTDFYDRELIKEEFYSLESIINWIKEHPYHSERTYPRNKWWWFAVSQFNPSKTSVVKLSKIQRLIEWFSSILDKRYGRDWMITKSPPNGTEIIRAEKIFLFDWDGNHLGKEPIKGYHKLK